MEIQPPTPLDRRGVLRAQPSIFLGGSIEMGTCGDWQAEISPKLQEMGWLVLNPRRKDWDSSWVQSIENPIFVEQVEWELTGLENAGEILMYFDPATKAPISLYELGAYQARLKMTVVCPEGYWRKGNVDVVCRWWGTNQLPSLEAALEYYRKRFLDKWS